MTTRLVQKQITSVYKGNNLIWWKLNDNCLYFSANTPGSTVSLTKVGSPTAVTLETCTDGVNWNTYTFGTTITLSGVGDKVYFRNTSATKTGFSTSTGAYYKFVMTGSINAGGDVGYLMCKTGYPSNSFFTQYCFYMLFAGCTSLVVPPKFPNIAGINTYSFTFMYRNCSGLEKLPIINYGINTSTYQGMFYNCAKIKLSTTKGGEYQIPYRIPYYFRGSGSGQHIFDDMFTGTGGTFAGTPTVNTLYYTANEIV